MRCVLVFRRKESRKFDVDVMRPNLAEQGSESNLASSVFHLLCASLLSLTQPNSSIMSSSKGQFEAGPSLLHHLPHSALKSTSLISISSSFSHPPCPGHRPDVQHQETIPGLEHKMTPAPEYLKLANGKNYKGSEKLEGKVAFITVRTRFR